MKAYKYVECSSGVIHWVLAKTEPLAKQIALDYANQPFEKGDEEYIIPEELELVEMTPDSDLKLYCDTHNPITHTVEEWEQIYSNIDQPVMYMGCSEY